MLNTKVRKSIVFLMSILRVGGYTVLANLVFIGICILKKVRKSIWQSFETAYLRTFCNTLKTENPVFISIRFFKKVRKSFEAYRIRVSVGEGGGFVVYVATVH